MKNTDPVSLIAHKMRTPLTVIMSTVNNFIDGAFGKLPESQLKWLKKVESQTKNLEFLLNEILGLLRSQSNQTQHHIQASITASIEDSHPPQTKGATPPSILGNSPASSRVPHILIVDDEPDILEIIQEGMRSKGFSTKTCSSGQAALGQAKQTPPDLILMDVHLQDGNGVEFSKTIKSGLSEFVPVILVTGQNDLQAQLSESNSVVDDILMKPFLMEELFARVSSMLRIKKLHDELTAVLTKAA